MKNDRVYLDQILDSIRKVRQFVHGMEQSAFMSDQKTQSAVIMQLALIGELAKKISVPQYTSPCFDSCPRRHSRRLVQYRTFFWWRF